MIKFDRLRGAIAHLLMLSVITLAFAADRRRPAPAPPPDSIADIPSISLPAHLPTATLPQKGMQEMVNSAVRSLERSLWKSCPKCHGSGAVVVGETGGFIREKIKDKCNNCGGSGRVLNDTAPVTSASLGLMTALAQMSPEAKGADDALNKAYDAVNNDILARPRYFRAIQAASAGAISQTKVDLNKPVLTKCLYGYTIDHPDRPGEKIYILRVSHKEQLLAVVAPKQADPPKAGGRTLVGGIIGGQVDVDTGKSTPQRVVIVERGILLAPNIDESWWNDE